MTSRTRQPGITVPRLDDGVVTVRGMRGSDVDAIVEHGGDPLMSRWTTAPAPYTPGDATDFLAHVGESWRRGSGFTLAVETEGRWAGSIDLRPQGAGLAEIGFSTAAWARGRSVASRAVRLVLGWAFGALGQDTVRWTSQRGNWPSRRVAWATGFRHEGTVTALLEHQGRRVDGWVATLRRGEPMRPVQPWWETVRLAGPGVVLRGHAETDATRMVEACRDPVSQHWLTDLPADYRERHALDHIAHLGEQAATGRAVFWAIAQPDTDVLIGEVMVAARDGERKQGEIGYWVHPDARGRGVMTAAGRLAVRHALLPEEDGGLGMERMLVRAAEGNTASQRIALRLGFSPAGSDRAGTRLRDGGFADDRRYDLLAAELPAVRG